MLRKNKITFTNVFKNYDFSFATPKPASKVLPQWYKEMPSYSTEDGKKTPPKGPGTTATIKKCVPVFDALTSGYILTTVTDVYVRDSDNGIFPYFQWIDFNAIEFHPVVQAEKYPGVNETSPPFPKWMSPWSIKTPKGYSCLFIAPMHQNNEYFKILPGIVDTDKYASPVNFPFILKPGFRGLIPVGTPMAQVIPFKRESWKMNLGGEDEQQKVHKELNIIKSRFFDAYRSIMWTKKEFT